MEYFVGLLSSPEIVRSLTAEVKALGFTIKALWTCDLSVTVQVASEFEIPFAASAADEVLLRKEVELIIISGVPPVHAQISIKALGIGKHVVCDAPFALSEEDSLKVVQAAQYYPQLIGIVGFGMRHISLFNQLKVTSLKILFVSL